MGTSFWNPFKPISLWEIPHDALILLSPTKTGSATSACVRILRWEPLQTSARGIVITASGEHSKIFISLSLLGVLWLVWLQCCKSLPCELPLCRSLGPLEHKWCASEREKASGQVEKSASLVCSWCKIGSNPITATESPLSSENHWNGLCHVVVGSSSQGVSKGCVDMMLRDVVW